jgi:hypothetical protein
VQSRREGTLTEPVLAAVRPETSRSGAGAGWNGGVKGELAVCETVGGNLKAAVEHVVPSRGHTDSEELRSAIERASQRRPPQGERPAAAAAPPGSIEMGGLGRYVAHRAASVRATSAVYARAIESCCAPT